MPLKIDFPWFINRTDMLYYLSSTNQIHKKTSNFTYQLILTKSQEKPTISPSLYVRQVCFVFVMFSELFVKISSPRSIHIRRTSSPSGSRCHMEFMLIATSCVWTRHEGRRECAWWKEEKRSYCWNKERK